MAIISKMLKGIFGDKSSKDRKLIWPIVEQINEFQNTIIDKSDDDLKASYLHLRSQLADLISLKKNIYKNYCTVLFF